MVSLSQQGSDFHPKRSFKGTTLLPLNPPPINDGIRMACSKALRAVRLHSDE